MLNSVSKSVASSLYTKGYNASLAPRKGRAGGHIPNFADPEREQAARGGYAAGTIRSMNMPGEGSVIYNSAEKVKNFKGMSQPAIMPPHSSKAGKNYQQAFGDVHGFDPYAAGGYIPNFASAQEIGSRNAKKAGEVLNADGGIVLLTANYPGKDLASPTFWVRDASEGEAGTGTRVHKGVNTMQKSLKNRVFSGKKLTTKGRKPTEKEIDNSGVTMRQVKVPTFSLDKSDSKINLPKNKSFQDYAYKKLKNYGKNLTIDLANRLMPDQKIGKFKGNKNAIEDNDVAVMGGRIFEKVLEAITQEIKGLSGGHKGALLDIPANPKLFEVFGAKLPIGRIGAEAKISSDEKHMKSAARKIFDVLSGTKEADVLSKAFPGKKTFSKTSDIKNKAYGHIPNFANPLSDAIGREKEAGVPVSKIRIGSHSALMNKSNPIGLGVTNTDDEPNGLKDVFGAANGFVPNYAPEITSSDVVGYRGSGAQSQTESNAKKYNKAIAGVIKRFETGRVPHKKMQEMMQKLGNKYNVSSSAQDRVAKKTNQLIGTTEKLKAATQRAARSVGLQNASSRFAGTRAGRMIGSTGGQMGLMMGLPMAAGFAQDAIGGTAGAATGGFLQGAGSGAAMGMMFGPLGTAIGATVGGLYGLVDGLGKAEEAAIASKKAHSEYSKTIGNDLGRTFFSSEKTRMNFQKELPSLQKRIANADAKVAASTKVVNRAPISSAWGGYAGSGGPTVVESSKGAKAAAEATRSKAMLDVRKAIGDTLLSISPDRKISMKEILTEEELKKGKVAETKEYTGAQYFEEINKKVKGDDQLRVVFNQIVDSFKKTNKVAQDQAKAVIIQLDIQKAQIAAQQAAAMSQLEIKDRYSKIADKLNFQDKLTGSLMTDQQKAMVKYKKALNGAAEKFASSKNSADSVLKLGLISQVGKDDNIQGLLKRNMANLNEGSSVQDITKEISKLSGEELDAKLREIAGQSDTSKSMRDAINKALSTEADKRQNLINLAEEEQLISENKIKRERRLNLLLADRSQALKNLQRENRMESEGIRSSQKIRGFTDQVAAARRLNAVGPGYQTGRERESSAISEKGFKLQSKIKTIEENRNINLKKLEEDKLKISDLTEGDKEKITRIASKRESERSKKEIKFFKEISKISGERQIQLDEIEQKIKKHKRRDKNRNIKRPKTLREREKKIKT